MININDLWIGDTLQELSTGRIGSYEGKVGSKIKLKVKHEIIFVAHNDLRPYVEKEIVQEIVFDEAEEAEIKNNAESDTIDLHIDILAPHMANQSQARILDFQLEKATTFIKNAIQNRRYRILIIHGKGQGILKSEVNHLLKQFDKVRYIIDKNMGGATEVWLDI